MTLIKAKPTSPGRRFVVSVKTPGLHKGKPHAGLVEKKAKAGGRNNQPISHVDIYPSLCEFAGIPKPPHLEGRSVLPLLKNSSATRDVAFLSYGPENTAAQSERYRYIRYEDGSEELYDHQKDPHEWTNQSENPEFSTIKENLKAAVLDFQNK